MIKLRAKLADRPPSRHSESPEIFGNSASLTVAKAEVARKAEPKGSSRKMAQPKANGGKRLLGIATGRINALKRLGVKGRVLGMAYSGLGAWAIARRWAMQPALKTKTLNNYGFIIPWGFAETGKWQARLTEPDHAGESCFRKPIDATFGSLE